jgi:hypothetical protein
MFIIVVMLMQGSLSDHTQVQQGVCSARTVELLQSCAMPLTGGGGGEDDGIRPTTLFPRRNDVAGENDREFAHIQVNIQ